MKPLSTAATPRTHTTEPVETLETHETTVACDGGAGTGPSPLGHPLVYLTIGASGMVDCPYCGRRFVLKK
jgi:uncharacterized Zn-finger protein